MRTIARRLLTIFMLAALSCGIMPGTALSAPVVRELKFSKKTTLAYPATVTLRFSLWDAADPADSTGSMLWSEETEIHLTSAVISHRLGSVTPGSLDAVDFSGQLWVQVERKRANGTFRRLPPRDRLGVVPYSLWSAGAASGGSISAVEAGTGLTGGGSSGAVTLSADIGIGSGQVASGGHGHDDAYVNEGQAASIGPEMIRDGAVTAAKIFACEEGEFLVFLGGTWTCGVVVGAGTCAPGDFLNCYGGPAGTLNVGECRPGTRTCNDLGSGFGTCQGTVLPVEETCDGRDEDCDGIVDNAAGAPLWYHDADHDGFGDPAASVHRCQQPDGYVSGAGDCDDGSWSRRPGRGEFCDEVDDDCDGVADDTCTATSCTRLEADAIYGCLYSFSSEEELVACITGASLSSPCGTALESLIQEAWFDFEPICGLGNADCLQMLPHGVAVFGPFCQEGDARSCGSDVGLCEAGVSACTGGRWQSCQGLTGPIEEVCGNDLDEDCDGVADNPEQCADGDGDGYPNGQDCDPENPDIHPGASELCDGRDNDCDEEYDEGFDIDAPCDGSDADSCTNGMYVCSPEGTGAVCQDDWGDFVEECDGQDNDCDGAIDEGLSGPECSLQAGVCSGALMSCLGEQGWTDCNPGDYGPDFEVSESRCDGLDNDCDGTVDEDLARPPCDTQVGVCSGSVKRCGATEWLTCDSTDFGPDYQLSEDRCDGMDNDCDGIVDEDCDLDGDDWCNASRVVVGTPPVCPNGGGDCNDWSSTVHPGADEICNGQDEDCDAVLDEGCDDDNDNWCDEGMAVVGTPPTCTAGGGDCDDDEAAMNPGATEVCDGLDNDCDGDIDEEGATGCLNYFEDADADCVGANIPSGCFCEAVCFGCGCPTTLGGDCDDFNMAVTPGRPELCNGFDDNCVNGVDEGFEGLGDACFAGIGECARQGWVVCGTPTSTMCDAVPGMPGEETCDGRDNDCDGVVDEEGATGCGTYYYDADGDTYGLVGNNKCLCAAAGNYRALVFGDCNDSNSNVNPGATEIPGDGVDQNCNVQELCYTDEDNDNYGTSVTIVSADMDCVDLDEAPVSGDCDDANASRRPGATEICDGIDDDCDGSTDEGCDVDGDDWCKSSMVVVGPPPVCPNGGGDCDDANASRYPGATEGCNGMDDDCNGVTDEGCP